MPRTALTLAYSGANYCGWQYQADAPSVQAQVEQAVSQVADAPVTVHCAGRTDTGVHATRQVIHFDANTSRPAKAWLLGVSALLPEDISVTWAGDVSPDFDARRSALARRYCYLIFNSPIRSALLAGQMAREHRPLDAGRMHEAAQALIGEQDFTSFRAAGCQSLTPIRNVHEVSVRRQNDLVIIDITANAFLHHMVRNIAGSLMDMGAGQHDADWLAQLLARRDRTQAGRTAAAGGLYLIDVVYPPEAGLPQGPALPHLLGGLA